MSNGLQTTLKVLGESANEAAVATLLAALDLRDRSIQESALRTLLQRRSVQAEHEVLRRWDQLGSRWQGLVAQRAGWLSGTVRKAILGQDPALYRNACDAAVCTRDFDLIPLLAGAAQDKTNPHAQRSAATVLELAELLHDEVHSPRDYRIRRDPQLQRSYVLPSLEKAVETFPQHGFPELIEAFLLLALRDNAVLKHILQSPNEPCHVPVSRVLNRSPKPGILRLLLSYLDDSHAPLPALQIMAKRKDAAFLRQTFRKIGGEPAGVVRGNLKRIESVAWFHDGFAMLDALSDAELPGVVQFVAVSGIDRRQAFELLKHMLRQESVAARRAAGVALAGFRTPEANELAVKTLSDSDPQVRAAMLAQLRARDVPVAIALLLPYLDSPWEVEREAAAKGLEEFTFIRYLTAFDGLSEAARESTGLLVKKVDPQALALLRAELQAPSRSRRQRALDIASAMDAIEQLQDVITGLLADDDQYLKLDVIRTLTGHDTPVIRAALRQALLDHHALVQAAAEQALAGTLRGKTEPVSGSLTSTTVIAPTRRTGPPPADQSSAFKTEASPAARR